MECLGRYTFFVMTSVILSGGVNMSDEHGMLREVYIFVHDFCSLSTSPKLVQARRVRWDNFGGAK